MIRIDSPTHYTVPKRLYALGHFSKFIKPGYVRIGADDEAYSGLRVSAYKNPKTKEFAVVVINDDRKNNRTVHFNLKNFYTNYVKPYLTDSKNDMKKLNSISVKNEGFTMQVGAESMITIVGKC